MYYLDSQRTVTRRDSSLITTGRRYLDDYETASTARGGRPSPYPFAVDSTGSLVPRPKGSIRKEITTVLFESMLDHIVDTWDVIETSKPEDSYGQIEKTLSEVTFSKKKNRGLSAKPSKTKHKSHSKLDLVEAQSDPMQISWWNQPDEKAIIHFKNGNVYEGNISMKSMNGEGRFQWADGTLYLGGFKDNEIAGKGMIKWKDDTWYEGEFQGNLRHGKGLYVDSRLQRHYIGGWYCGTKDGKGAICYSTKPVNTYDGDWVLNVRHGFGTREYCSKSGYQGDWDQYVREGKGLMIWPNSDVYKGEWKNGIMSGYGMYIWEAYRNYSMSLPSINVYRGCWHRGQRSGFGILNLGLGMGSHYKGQFKENRKNGMGKFVTNNGLIFKAKQLFIEDSLNLKNDPEHSYNNKAICKTKLSIIPVGANEPDEFDICDNTVGFRYHVEECLKNIDKQAEFRTTLINEYIDNNRVVELDLDTTSCDLVTKISDGISEDMIEFETEELQKTLRCYERDLKRIYYKYATVCNLEPINFTPLLIRLYLWQFFYDCDMHEKGLTLVEIDNIFMQNRDWLARIPHGPFEKIYLWQFLQCVVAVACKLYAKRTLPGPRPDTITATAFRQFMDNDALPNFGRCKGYLPQSFGSYMPLKALYRLYQVLGEPHTVRTFLCAVNRSKHLYMDYPQPDMVDASSDSIPVGRNAYVFADEITFYREDPDKVPSEKFEIRKDTQLFNFGNLSNKMIIIMFTNIFPGVYSHERDQILDLDVQMTFFEFFQIFIACAKESIRVKDEENKWRDLLESLSESLPTARPGTAQTAQTQKIEKPTGKTP